MFAAPALLLLSALAAPAEPSPPTEPEPAARPAPHPRAAEPPPTEQQPKEDDFDLFGDTKAKTSALQEPNLEAQITRRRSMLSVHQILGLSTLVLTAATVIMGQLNYNHLYGANADGRDSLILTHRILGYASFGAFATTAGFSILAPKPVTPEARGFSTVDVHRIAVVGATLGMLTQVGLGFAAGRSADAGNPSAPGRLAGVHQVVGWTTLGFLTTAAVALLL